MERMIPVAQLVSDFLNNQATLRPDKVAIVYQGRETTYKTLNSQAAQVCNWLHQVGVKHGDRVLLLGANGDRLVAALFGILKAGAVFVPVNPKTPTPKLNFIIRDSTPKAIVVDAELLDFHESLLSGIIEAILITSSTLPKCFEKNAIIAPWDALPECIDLPPLSDNTLSTHDLAAIIYTSGSTKEPRGVMEPHQQIVFATSAINEVIGNSSEDTILCGIPLSFDYGLYQIFLAFQVGAKIILEKDFSVPMGVPRILKLHKVSGFPAVPSIFSLLLRTKLLERIELPDLKYITSTGDVFPLAQILKLRELLPNVNIFPMYGLTECKRVSIVPKGQLEGHEASVGLPLPGTEVIIVNDDGLPVPPETVGELVVRGPHVMAGYWNDAEETARRFQKDNLSEVLSLHTGDKFKKDIDGFLYFVGRDGSFIKSHGQKISPAEIETSLYEIKGVAEAAVVGVPESTLGEFVFAFVSLTEPRIISTIDIAEKCKHLLSPIERPKHIIILNTLPKTTNGKIDRSQLQQIAIRLTKNGSFEA